MTISQRPQVSLVLCDLDDCLYDNTTMQHACAENIRRYMAERLAVPADEVAEKCADYYLNYGTTLAGLVANGYKIDYDDWHAFVHGTLDYDTYLQPDPALRAMLASIPLPKFVFTNADRTHARRCLERLGLEGVFDGVICFEDVMEAAAEAGLVHHGRPVVCKPNRQAFDIALKLAGGGHPSTTLWLDDSARNCTTGHRLGMYSVLVGRTGVACPSDHQIRHIQDLPQALPWLWQGQQPPPAPAAVLEEAAAAAQAMQEQEQAADGTAVVSAGGPAALKAAAAAKAGGGGGGGSGASSSDTEAIEAVYVAA